jgi:tetratricopeptide (TPR) repeat protein
MLSAFEKLNQKSAMKIPPYLNFLITGILLFCFSACTNNHVNGRKSLSFYLADSLSLKEACIRISSDLCSGPQGATRIENQRAFYAAVDKTGDSLFKALGPDAHGPQGAYAIIRLVYDRWGIGFDARDTIVETLLPETVYMKKKGACLGVSLIILLLAEKLECPVHGVLLPGHFYCRFDNGTDRFNIEPNKSGFNHPDDYYREKYLSEKKPWYDLKNLLAKETVGVLCFNAGNLFLKRKDFSRARAYFAESVRRLPTFIEAKGNVALTFAQSGDLEKSKMLFDTLFNKVPDLNGLAGNYGAVLIASKDFKKAKEVFTKGLFYFPNDSSLLAGLAKANP